MNNINIHKIFIIFLIATSFTSFFAGFYLDENSAGSGTYDGDFTHAWQNMQVYLNNDFFLSLDHQDYYSGRTPLAYILHEIFNPFLSTEIEYRRSVFGVSLMLPILFYFCLRKKFINEDKILLLLIASTVCLSPYFRTSAYWGLEENYGLIFLLLSFLSLDYLLNNNAKTGHKIYIQIFLVTLISSCCLYFDYKLAIIPIICFIKIIFSKKIIIQKIFAIFCYSLFSFPLIYLIVLWGGLVQGRVEEVRAFGEELYFYQVGYMFTIICLYITPLLLFKNENFILLLKNFFIEKKNYYLLSLFLVYFFYLLNGFVFSELTFLEKGYSHIGSNFFNEPVSIGKGFIHKLAIVFFNDIMLRKIFTYTSFFFSWVIILIYINKNINDAAILFYFFIISLLVFPILQEYFDPLIILMAFTFFNTKIIINYKNSVILYIYLVLLLAGSNIYYFTLSN